MDFIKEDTAHNEVSSDCDDVPCVPGRDDIVTRRVCDDCRHDVTGGGVVPVWCGVLLCCTFRVWTKQIFISDHNVTYLCLMRIRPTVFRSKPKDVYPKLRMKKLRSRRSLMHLGPSSELTEPSLTSITVVFCGYVW